MKKRIYIFVAISIVMAVIFFFISSRLEPWFYAVNTRVRLHMEAPANTKINICWDKSQGECLPLVPYSETDKKVAASGQIAAVWLSQLPPRPTYHVSLIFESAVHGVILHELDLDTPSLGGLPGAGIGSIQISPDQFQSQNISYTLRDGLYYLESKTHGGLTLVREIKPGPINVNQNGITTLTIWALLFSIYVLFAIPLYLFPNVVRNIDVAIKDTHLPYYPWWVYLLCFVAVSFMLLLVVNSAIVSFDSDPINYLQLATGGGWFNQARLPGYPLFLGLALRISSNSTNGVVLLQVIVLALSVLICVWVLRKWLHPFAALLFVFLVLFSPAQVNWARWILRESLFASLILLAITAIIAHFTTNDKLLSKTWLVIYTIICGAAFLVRENGILLPVALLPVLLPRIIKCFKSPDIIWKRVHSAFLLITPYISPVLCIGMVYIGFSSYNYLHYGYFQIGIHQTSHHFLWREISTANFDSRSLLKPETSMNKEAKAYLGWPLYSSFILAIDKGPALDPIYTSIFPIVNQKLYKKGQPVNKFHSAAILDDIGKGASHLVSWEADVVGVLRQYTELISLYAGNYPLISDDPATLAHKQKLLAQVSKNIKYEGKEPQPGGIIARYYKASQGYSWYGLLLVLALLSSLYILRYKDPAFLAPIAFFIANCILLLATRLVDVRYFVSLDILLILQIALGLSCWIYKSLRKFELPERIR